MQEEFLYFIWQQRLLLAPDLRLTNGEKIEIIHPGYRNYESGPDFFNARIRIGDMLWAGNVEIHTRASDWHRHHHTGDLSYDNIILHAVAINDTEIRRLDGSVFPTLVMAGKFPDHYSENYRHLMESHGRYLPCSAQLLQVNELIRRQVLDRMLTERLESRFTDLEAIVTATDKRWPEAFHRLLGRSFGFKTNATPFELLTNSLPHELLIRHRDNTEDIEALLYGQAGLLPPQPSDPYAERLKRQYRFFQA